MEQLFIDLEKELFDGSDIVRRYTFKAADQRGNSALLARANRQLAQGSAVPGEKSAHFSIDDCFVCLPLLPDAFRACNCS